MAMSGSFILDTNILIALFANEQRVLDEIGKSKQTFIPSIVIGELYCGAFNSARAKENMDKIDLFKKQVPYFFAMMKLPDIMGRLKSNSKTRGLPFLKTTSGLPHFPSNTTSHL